MRHITIYRRYFTKSPCYQGAYKQKSIGVQVHSTGANNSYLHRYVGPDDGRLGPNKYGNTHNRSGKNVNVCASAYIGKLQDGTVAIYQALPWDYRCWLSANGSNGNANRLGYIGYEICEDDKKHEDYFRAAVMGAAVDLTAYLCLLMDTSPYEVIASYKQGDALAVMDHQELHKVQLASDHGDILHWLKIYKLTMNDFRDAVLQAMKEGIEVTYIDCDTGESWKETYPGNNAEVPAALYLADIICSGYLNLRSSKSTNAASIKKLYKGELVEVLDDSDNTWWKVRSGGVTGYAMRVTDKGLLYMQRHQEAAEKPPEKWTVKISGLDQQKALEIVSIYGGDLVKE